jgi:two-component system, chemotaxis family, protein-glutamate methylesterase/glutaminase
MRENSFYVVGIGASAGGQHALKEFFLNLPTSPGIAFVVVTHLLRDYRSILDTILSRFTSMHVVRMKGGDIIRPNTVYVMPENVKVYVKNGSLILKPREQDYLINKTIDEFFHSLGEDQKDKAVAIVFSGMGTDGIEGVKTIHEFGGTVLVQDPASTTFKSMPDTIIKEDHPDRVLPPAELAHNLIRIISEKEKQSVERM